MQFLFLIITWTQLIPRRTRLANSCGLEERMWSFASTPRHTRLSYAAFRHELQTCAARPFDRTSR